jgi:hypothetical protein
VVGFLNAYQVAAKKNYGNSLADWQYIETYRWIKSMATGSGRSTGWPARSGQAEGIGVEVSVSQRTGVP